MNTTYWLNLVMGNIFRTKTSPSIPSGLYLGMSSTEPNINGSGVGEPNTTGTAYARVLLDSLSEPVNGVITNNSAISFPESIAAWGTMRYYVVYDAPTNGNLLYYGALSVNRVIEPNTIITIRAGELSVNLENPAA